MSGAKHTQGPWFTGKAHFGRYSIYSEHSVGGQLCGQGRQSICIAHYEGKGGSKAYHDMFKANAHLIAAAPELLDVVKGFRRKLETYVSVYPGDKELRMLLSNCDAAIAKATEAQP